MSKKIIKVILSLLLVLLLATAVGLAWLNSGPLNETKEKVIGSLPLPAAWVGGRPVTLHEYLNRRGQAESYAKTQGQQLTQAEKSALFNRLLQEKIILEIARQHGVSPTGNQAQDELEARKTRYEIESVGNFAKELAKYGLSEQEYKETAVKADVAAANLTTWFYSQRDLNAQAYIKADSILDKIRSGEDFSGLVMSFSEDAQGKSVGGDTGSLPINSFLPEIAGQIVNWNIGETKLVPTRFGLEIIRLEDRQQAENGKTMARLRQIYLPGEDFNAWFSNESKKIKIIKIVNL